MKVFRNQFFFVIALFGSVYFFYTRADVKAMWKKLSTSHNDKNLKQKPNDTIKIFEKKQIQYISDIIQNHVPEWFQMYLKWHTNRLAELSRLDSLPNVTQNISEIQSQTKHFRFLCVVCLEGMRCGGTADRIKNLPYWILEANRTSRILLIHWDKSNIFLEDFWTPPSVGLDWSIPANKSTVLHKIFHHPHLSNISNSCIGNKGKKVHYGQKPIPGGDNGGSQIVCVQDYHITQPEYMEKYCTSQHNNSYPYVFKTLFQPSFELRQYIKNFLTQSGLLHKVMLDTVRFVPKQLYLAVHVRSTYPLRSNKSKKLIWPSYSSKPYVAAYCADHAVDAVIKKYVHSVINSTGHPGNLPVEIPPIYVTSSDTNIVKYLKHGSMEYGDGGSPSSTNRSVGSSRTTTVGGWKVRQPTLFGSEEVVRANINFYRGNPVNLYGVFFDLWMLSNSRCIAYGVGGFGRLSSQISITSSDCVIQHRLMKDFESTKKDAKAYWKDKGLPRPTALEF